MFQGACTAAQNECQNVCKIACLYDYKVKTVALWAVWLWLQGMGSRISNAVAIAADCFEKRSTRMRASMCTRAPDDYLQGLPLAGRHIHGNFRKQAHLPMHRILPQ